MAIAGMGLIVFGNETAPALSPSAEDWLVVLQNVLVDYRVSDTLPAVQAPEAGAIYGDRGYIDSERLFRTRLLQKLSWMAVRLRKGMKIICGW
jgi:hypothetical protein